MGIDAIKILHLDSVKEWRGGQQQVFYLLSGMRKKNLVTLLACQPNSILAQKCEEAGIEFVLVRMRNELDFIAGRRIAEICKKRKINILHAHSAHALSIALWARLFYRPVKIIAARRVDFSVRKSPFSIWKYKNRFVDKIICISTKIKNVMLADGVPQEKLVRIYSGIDLNKFTDREKNEIIRAHWNIPDDHFLVGTVAAIVGHKDYPTLLQAAKIATEENHRIVFLAVGAGKDEVKNREIAKKLALGDRFLFAGFQKDIGPYLQAFDIFIAASRREGLGTSLLDALAMGLPVVGTDAGGIPESVQDGVNGFLVPKQNPQALARAILDLTNNADLRRQFSKNAPATVEKFAIANTVSQTIGLYKDLLANERAES